MRPLIQKEKAANEPLAAFVLTCKPCLETQLRTKHHAARVKIAVF